MDKIIEIFKIKSKYSDANQKGIDILNNARSKFETNLDINSYYLGVKDAIKKFEKALKKDPYNTIIKKNLEIAKSELEQIRTHIPESEKTGWDNGFTKFIIQISNWWYLAILYALTCNNEGIVLISFGIGILTGSIFLGIKLTIWWYKNIENMIIWDFNGRSRNQEEKTGFFWFCVITGSIIALICIISGIVKLLNA